VIKIIETIIIPALFFILGIIITILLTYFIFYKKVIRCIIVPSISLVGVSKDVQEKTKIFYNDRVVTNLSSTTLKIRNSSLSGLTDEQFITPIKIIFDNTIELLEYEIIEESYPGRITKISLKDNVATIEKITLLNKWDSIIVRFVHQGVSENKIPTINSDIKDFEISQVRGMLKGKKQASFMLVDGLLNTFMGLSLAALGTLLIFSIYTLISTGIDITPFYPLIIMAVVFLIFSIFILYKGIRKLYTYFTRVIEVKTKEG
jgi:hypothetical protein